MREDTDTRAIDNFIVRLRRYLEDDPANPVFLRTVRGIGYRFEPQSIEPQGSESQSGEPSGPRGLRICI